MILTFYRFDERGRLTGEPMTSRSDVDVDLGAIQTPKGMTLDPPPPYEEGNIPVFSNGAWAVHELAEYLPTLEQVKAAKIAEIKNASLYALASGYVFSNGWRGNCGLDDVLMLRGGIEIVEEAGGTELAEYRDYNNDRHFHVPIETAKLMLKELVIYQATVFHKKWEYQDAARDAETPEAVAAIVWE